VLLLIWSNTLAVITVACGVYHIYDRVHQEPTILDYYIVGATAFGVLVLLILLPFTFTHIQLIIYNSTTLEHLEKRSRFNSPYDMGWRSNFVQVFGSNPLLWLLPVMNSYGDGITFPCLPANEASSLLLRT